MRLRRVYFLVLVAILCGSLSVPAYAVETTNKTATPYVVVNFPVKLKDYSGRQVVIPHMPKRIISIGPSATEVLFALGLGERVVGVDPSSDFPEAAKSKTVVGTGMDISMEKVIAQKPDLVLFAMDWGGSKALADKLTELKIPAFFLSPQTVSDTIRSIELIGQLTNRAGRARVLANGMRTKLAEIQKRVAKAKKTRVFFEVWNDPIFTVGPGTFMNDMIRLAGGINVMADATTPWPMVSLENVVTKDPQVIINPNGCDAESYAKRENWGTITAVKTGRCVAVDPNLTQRNGPRVVDGLELIARAIHPEVFR